LNVQLANRRIRFHFELKNTYISEVKMSNDSVGCSVTVRRCGFETPAASDGDDTDALSLTSNKVAVEAAFSRSYEHHIFTCCAASTRVLLMFTK
jgi:hypothetical protein